MEQRLSLLESYLETRSVDDLKARKAQYDIFKPKDGSLTIVDLSDPLIDASFACIMFDICLSLFLEGDTKGGKMVALDEAHKVSTALFSLQRVV